MAAFFFGVAMRFYTVRDDYINFLKSFESKVMDNYSEKRPYVGVVLSVGGIEYLAPLTSPKAKHDNLDGTKPTIFKIYESGNPSNKLGILSICNMIPVRVGVYSALAVKNFDIKYQLLLAQQLHSLKANQATIQSKAEKLRRFVIEGKVPAFNKVSCDFVLLEKRYLDFK